MITLAYEGGGELDCRTLPSWTQNTLGLRHSCEQVSSPLQSSSSPASSWNHSPSSSASDSKHTFVRLGALDSTAVDGEGGTRLRLATLVWITGSSPS